VQKDVLAGAVMDLCEKSPWVARQVRQMLKDGYESGLIESPPETPNPVAVGEKIVPESAD
jgi:hypothetical protein